MRALGIILARKGSRRIKRKNTRPLGGKPLVVWTFECAKKSKRLDRVVVSTDDEEVKRLAEEYKIEVPFFPRPRELAEDVDSVLPLKHAVEFLEEKQGYIPSHVVLLQPTSPFREPSDIDGCILIAEETRCDTVITIKEVSQHPYWMFKAKMGRKGFTRLEPYEKIDLAGDVLVWQNLPKLYYPTGDVYVIKTELVKKGRIFGETIYGYLIPRERAIDIEEEVDLLLAEAIIEQRKHLLRWLCNDVV